MAVVLSCTSVLITESVVPSCAFLPQPTLPNFFPTEVRLQANVAVVGSHLVPVHAFGPGSWKVITRVITTIGKLAFWLLRKDFSLPKQYRGLMVYCFFFGFGLGFKTAVTLVYFNVTNLINCFSSVCRWKRYVDSGEDGEGGIVTTSSWQAQSLSWRFFGEEHLKLLTSQPSCRTASGFKGGADMGTLKQCAAFSLLQSFSEHLVWSSLADKQCQSPAEVICLRYLFPCPLIHATFPTVFCHRKYLSSFWLGY